MRSIVIVAALVLLAPSVAVGAEACKRLSEINSIDLVRENQGPRLLVPVSLDGTPNLFILDTVGGISQISRTFVQKHNLTVREAGGKLLDEQGFASGSAVIINEFGFGRLKAQKARLMIEPDPDFGKGTQYSGVLAGDMMGRYDMEIDAGAGKLNYFSPDHCPGHVIYWPADTVAVVPMQFQDGRIKVPVTLDGHAMTADIDTGDSLTRIDAGTAKRVFNLTEDSPDIVPLGTNGGKPVFTHVFHALTFEGVTINNPNILVLPNQVGSRDFDNGLQMDSLTRHEDDTARFPELSISMSVLKNLHLYIAFAEGKLYVTPATASLQKAPGSGTSAP